MAKQKSGLVGRKWLRDAVEQWRKNGPPMMVLIGEPGAGKTAFLRDLVKDESDSLWVSVRPTLGTNVGIGFWHALLAQLDLEGKRLPSTVHESVAWAEEMLPPGGKKERLIVVDSFERGGWLWDAGGLAGLDRPIPGVRVIIACRPGAHLAALYRGGAEVIALDSRDERNREDLRDYLKSEGLSNDKLETYLERSQGNFLVAQHFVREGLPEGDIVPGKLSLVLALAWRELLHSLPADMQADICLMAGLLSEAPEPLAPASIADFLGLSAARVHGLLEAMLPILRNQGEKICLFSRQMQIVISNLLRRDLVATHGRVVAFFRETYPSWEEMNDIYGWMYLGYHCDRLARSSRRRDFSILHWLCEGPYIHSKLARTGSVRSVLEDLHRGLEAALEEGDLPRILAYGLGMPRMRANQTAVITHHQADSGDFDRALDNARMIAAEGCRFKTFLLLAWQAWEEGRHELAQSILDEALAIPLPQFRDVDLPLVLRILADFASDPNYTEKAFALLALEEEPLRQATYWLGFGRISVLGDPLRKRAFKAGLECLKAAPAGPPRDLREAALVSGLAELGENLPVPERAPDRVDRKVFSRAKTPQKAFGDLLGAVSARPWDPGRVSGYVELGEALSEVRAFDWVPEAFLQLVQAAATVHVPAERLRAIFGLSSCLSRLERSDKALEAYERLSALAGAFDDRSLQAKALADIGVGLHRLRSTREASRSFSEAAAMAFTIEDPATRSETLSFVAGAVARTGHRARARDLAYHSIQVETHSVDIDHSCRGTMKMALMSSSEQTSTEYLQVGAEATLQADGLAPQLKAAALSTLAGSLSRLGDSEWGQKLLSQAVAAARAMSNGSQKAVTLANLATQFGMAGEDRRLHQLLKEAGESVEEASAAEQAEGLVAMASTHHQLLAHDDARECLSRAFAALSQLSALELTGSGALLLAAGLANRLQLKGEVEKLLKKASGSLKRLKGYEADEAHLALLKVEMALGQTEAALARLEQIGSVAVAGQARIELARATIRENPSLGLSLIRELSIHEQRMEAVRRATIEAFLEVRPSRMTQLRATLRELTLLATDDQATADLVCSRWIFFEPNPDVLRRAVIKMNWLEAPQPAATPAPEAAEQPESDGFSELELTSTK